MEEESAWEVSTHALWETPELLLQIGFLQTEMIVG